MPIKTNGSPERSASMSIPSPITGSVWVGGCFVRWSRLRMRYRSRHSPAGSVRAESAGEVGQTVPENEDRGCPHDRRTAQTRARLELRVSRVEEADRVVQAADRDRGARWHVACRPSGHDADRVRISALVDPAITAAATAIAAPAPRITRDFGRMIIPLIMCTTPSNSGPCSSRNPRP